MRRKSTLDEGDPASRSRPGTVITYFVPFTGEVDLFKYQPSTFTTLRPVGRVRDGHVEFRYVSVDASAEAVKREMDDAIGRVRKWIGFVNPEVETFNAQLPAWAQGAVDLRVTKVRAHRDLVASLGVPLRRRSDAPQTYVAPAMRRRPDIPVNENGGLGLFSAQATDVLGRDSAFVVIDALVFGLVWRVTD